jgi:hypothetical protein
LSTRIAALETKTQDVSYDDQTELTKTVQFNGSIDLGSGGFSISHNGTTALIAYG